MSKYPEVYKVIGAPGTGKTTTVVGNPDLELKGLFIEEMENGYPIEDQMLVTYTNAGVDEAADRLYRMLDEAKNTITNRVTTIHSRSFQLADLSRDDVVNSYEKRQFCNKMGLEYGWDSDDADDIMASEDTKAGNALFDLYGWLQSNRVSIENWEDCPADWPGQDDPEYLMREWEVYKAHNGLVGFGDMIERVVHSGLSKLKDEGLISGDINIDNEIEKLNEARNHIMRDPDQLRGEGPFVDTKVMYVDEVQDLTPLQWEWYLLQKLVCEKVYLGGDDDQCLPPNAPVEVKNNPMFNPEDGHKEFQKPIKDVQVGDLVRTLTSDGEYGYRQVSNVKTKEVNQKTFRTIRTESGHLTAVTDNHKMLARVPEAEYEGEVNKHYVYLMRDNEGRWRIGETDNLRQRLNVERGARCIIPVASFDSKEEALEKELEWSLNYSIPQLTIQQRDGEVLSDPDVRERLYDSVSPQYDLIERELGVFLDSPSLYKKSTTRGQTQSVNINIKKCADMRGDKPRHSFNVQTSDEDVKEVLREFNELSEGDSPSSTRFRTTSTDYKELGDLAKEVSAKTGGDIITTMSPTEERSAANVTPAGNLVEGMLVPVAKKGEVVWEEIVEINDRTETTEVYDLTVPGTHTFTTGGVGVSNTIYGWAGANPDFMLDEEGDFEVLDRTYRIPEEIWDVCDSTIQQVEKRQEKEVTPDGDGGEVVDLRRPPTRRIAEYIQDSDDVFILFRARYMIDEFCQSLNSQGIPYDNISTFDTWSDDVVNIRDAFATLQNGDGKLSHDELEALKDNVPNKCINESQVRSGKQSAFDKFGGLEQDVIEDTFTFKPVGGTGKLTLRQYMEHSQDYDDGLSYYQCNAVKGNIRNNNEDMYPDRVRIGTIHSAKGKEADTVILATDTTQTIKTQMMNETKYDPEKKVTDAERRVYYVGMTRASRRLVLAEGLVNPDMAIPIEHLTTDGVSSQQADLSSEWA